MSNKLQNFSLLLLVLLFIVGCWARPKCPTIFNDANSDETDSNAPAAGFDDDDDDDDALRGTPNDLLMQLERKRYQSTSPVVEYYNKQRELYAQQEVMSSPLMERLLHPGIAPGGVNYYSNDVSPYATYQLMQPQNWY